MGEDQQGAAGQQHWGAEQGAELGVTGGGHGQLSGGFPAIVAGSASLHHPGDGTDHHREGLTAAGPIFKFGGQHPLGGGAAAFATKGGYRQLQARGLGGIATAWPALGLQRGGIQGQSMSAGGILANGGGQRGDLGSLVKP